MAFFFLSTLKIVASPVKEPGTAGEWRELQGAEQALIQGLQGELRSTAAPARAPLQLPALTGGLKPVLLILLRTVKMTSGFNIDCSGEQVICTGSTGQLVFSDGK